MSGNSILESLRDITKGGGFIVTLSNLWTRLGLNLSNSAYTWNLFGARQNQAATATIATDTQMRNAQIQNNTTVIAETVSNNNVNGVLTTNPDLIPGSASGVANRGAAKDAADGNGSSVGFWGWLFGSDNNTPAPQQQAQAQQQYQGRVFGGGGGGGASAPAQQTQPFMFLKPQVVGDAAEGALKNMASAESSYTPGGPGAGGTPQRTV